MNAGVISRFFAIDLCPIFFILVSREIGQYLFSQIAAVNVCIDFRRTNTLVSQHRLYGSQICSTFEQMRLNLIRNYKRSWYLGLGANVNFNIKPTVVGTSAEGYVQNILPENTTKQWLNPVTYSPRVSFGVSRKHFNFELYGLYDLQPTFDSDHLEKINMQDYMHYQLYDLQLNNKWRIGAAMRILF